MPHTDDVSTLENNFFGAATVGERGQVVIPAEARKKMNIEPGDKLLAIGHPTGLGILLCKIDKVRDLFALLSEQLKTLENAVESTETNNE